MGNKIILQEEFNAIMDFLKTKWFLTEKYEFFLLNMLEKSSLHFKSIINPYDLTINEKFFQKHSDSLLMLINKQNVNHFIHFQDFFQSFSGQFENYAEVKPKQWEELLEKQSNSNSEFSQLDLYKHKEFKEDIIKFKGHDIISARRSFCLNVSTQNIILDCLGRIEEDRLPVKWLSFYIMEHLIYCIFKNNAEEAMIEITRKSH